jgi:FMN phosphatase YigB (HAD superfamily)
MPKAVLFDLWETLINDTPERSLPRRAWRTRAVLTVLQRHGCDAEPEAIQAALDASTSALSRMHEDGKDLGAGGRAQLFTANLLALAGLTAPAAADAELEDVITSMPLELAPVVAAHAVETTAEIKRRGLTTGLICNAGFTTTPHLLPLLDHHGLSPHLDAMVFSDEVLIAKPDPRIFASKQRDGIQPDARIDNLSQLIAVLEGLG